MRKVTLTIVSAVQLISASSVRGQSTQQETNPNSSQIVMKECEGTEGCGIWKFTRKKRDNYVLGSGVSPSGERTTLLLKFVDDKHTVLIISSNPETDEQVEYKGTEDKDGIAGKFHSDDNKKSGHWFAQPIQAIDRPKKIKYCGPQACHNLVLTSGNYVSVDEIGNPSGTKWTVEQFSADGVKIERQDPPSPNGSAGYRATLTGKILVSGKRIEGEQDGSFGPARVRFVMTWGSAYNDAHPTGNNPPGTYSMQPISAETQAKLWTQLARLASDVLESGN